MDRPVVGWNLSALMVVTAAAFQLPGITTTSSRQSSQVNAPTTVGGTCKERPDWTDDDDDALFVLFLFISRKEFSHNDGIQNDNTINNSRSIISMGHIRNVEGFSFR